jgi:hypothetical protein
MKAMPPFWMAVSSDTAMIYSKNNNITLATSVVEP